MYERLLWSSRFDVIFILFRFRFVFRLFLFPMREVHSSMAHLRHLTRRHSMTGCHAMSRIVSIANLRLSWLSLSFRVKCWQIVGRTRKAVSFQVHPPRRLVG